jgi:hypothetical protein
VKGDPWAHPTIQAKGFQRADLSDSAKAQLMEASWEGPKAHGKAIPKVEKMVVTMATS